ncbi:MAG: Holliday junction branch migration protein RuvA [Candidatus Nanopelagicaceae bacterium]
MIASVSGVVKATTLNSAVIEVGGVGLQVSLPARFAASLTVGTQTEIFTTLVVREDSLTLFGFDQARSRDFFELLQTVSGIGPKVAQSALSIYEPEEIASAISIENSAALERIPGLGKKGAQRAVLELKEKVSSLSFANKSSANGKSIWRDQLSSALIGLGFSSRDAQATIEAVSNELGASVDSTDIAQLLKLALQNQGRG